jgi:NAD(P)-dependent dehydrogenase (short-subunit alcohol dehydrogenase family)
LVGSVSVDSPLASDSLRGVRALVTGSSRGIGADTARYLAAAGARVVINYRNKEPRALKVVAGIEADGGEAIAIGADLTDPASLKILVDTIRERLGGLDLLVLNASGGMEGGMAEDYAMVLNRDAQVAVLDAALPLLSQHDGDQARPGGRSRVVFVTSHQAHFINSVPTMPEYLKVAKSKRAGEDALRERIPELDGKGIGFVVVSGDMIEGTITATLLDRARPGAIHARREEAGRLYSVSEFAAEVAHAAVDPLPEGHIRYVGDVSGFLNYQPHRD